MTNQLPLLGHSRTSRALASVLGFLLLVNPVAATQGDFRVLQISMLCFYKEPKYKTPFVKMLEARADFGGWAALDADPIAQCIRKMDWDANSFCADLASVNAEDRQAIDAMFRAHSDEFDTLRPAIEFIGQYTDARMFSSEKAPSCPFT